MRSYLQPSAQIRSSHTLLFAVGVFSEELLEKSEDMSADEEPAPKFSRAKTFGKGVDDSWKKIQERTFTNWVNDRLRGHLKVAKKQVRRRTL